MWTRRSSQSGPQLSAARQQRHMKFSVDVQIESPGVRGRIWVVLFNRTVVTWPRTCKLKVDVIRPPLVWLLGQTLPCGLAGTVSAPLSYQGATSSTRSGEARTRSTHDLLAWNLPANGSIRQCWQTHDRISRAEAFEAFSAPNMNAALASGQMPLLDQFAALHGFAAVQESLLSDPRAPK